MNLNIEQVNAALVAFSPEEIIRWTDTQTGVVAMTSSFGIDSAVFLRMVTRIIPDIPVVLVDNGLFSETLEHLGTLTKLFDLNVLRCSCGLSPEELNDLHSTCLQGGDKGMEEYQRITKVVPLRKTLLALGTEALLSGIRAEQTPHRASMRQVEEDEDGIYRIHPLHTWTHRQMDDYLALHELPRNSLYFKGYGSVGDIRTTRPGKGRSGRQLGEKTECGIHHLK
jgi:phosphoadenosine phosphosulfate reductase